MRTFHTYPQGSHAQTPSSSDFSQYFAAILRLTSTTGTTGKGSSWIDLDCYVYIEMGDWYDMLKFSEGSISTPRTCIYFHDRGLCFVLLPRCQLLFGLNHHRRSDVQARRVPSAAMQSAVGSQPSFAGSSRRSERKVDPIEGGQ